MARPSARLVAQLSDVLVYGACLHLEQTCQLFRARVCSFADFPVDMKQSRQLGRHRYISGPGVSRFDLCDVYTLLPSGFLPFERMCEIGFAIRYVVYMNLLDHLSSCHACRKYADLWRVRKHRRKGHV